jgi:hypothetical protein
MTYLYPVVAVRDATLLSLVLTFVVAVILGVF